MQERTILQKEEQEFYCTIGENMFQIRLFPFHDLMYVDVLLNSTDYIVTGQRVIQNQWILPDYLSEKYGNMRFETYVSDGDDYVWYTGFNDKYRLMLYTPKDIKELS